MSRQPGSDPPEDIIADTIILQFVDQSSMGDLIESLGKVHNNEVSLFMTSIVGSIQVFLQIMNKLD